MKKSFVAMSLLSGLLIAGGVFAGDAAADKARAKELREKAHKLLVQAEQDHEKAVKDFEAANSLEEKCIVDRSEARKLAHEAFLLDKDAAKDTRIDQIKGQIRQENFRAWQCSSAAKSHVFHFNRLETAIKDEQKAESDLKAAQAAETNPSRKNVIELSLASIADEVKADEKDAKENHEAAERDEAAAKWHHERAKAFEAELKKLEALK